MGWMGEDGSKGGKKSKPRATLPSHLPDLCSPSRPGQLGQAIAREGDPPGPLRLPPLSRALCGFCSASSWGAAGQAAVGRLLAAPSGDPGRKGALVAGRAVQKRLAKLAHFLQENAGRQRRPAVILQLGNFGSRGQQCPHKLPLERATGQTCQLPGPSPAWPLAAKAMHFPILVVYAEKEGPLQQDQAWGPLRSQSHTPATATPGPFGLRRCPSQCSSDSRSPPVSYSRARRRSAGTMPPLLSSTSWQQLFPVH